LELPSRRGEKSAGALETSSENVGETTVLLVLFSTKCEVCREWWLNEVKHYFSASTQLFKDV
jgi:hypothetical protein